jgi:hypothetical protein
MIAAQPFDRRVILVGGGLFAVLIAVSVRYGFQRDELYFLDRARHLQLSYVDQPVLAPLLTWVALKLFGASVVGLGRRAPYEHWADVCGTEPGGVDRPAPHSVPPDHGPTLGRCALSCEALVPSHRSAANPIDGCGRGPAWPADPPDRSCVTRAAESRQ